MLVSITIPSESQGAALQPGERAAVLANVISRMVSVFGGATTHEADGHWRNAAGAVVSEPVTVVSSYTGDVSPTQAERVMSGLAATVKATLRQECVMVSSAPDVARFV
jgi:hypothetical protein